MPFEYAFQLKAKVVFTVLHRTVDSQNIILNHVQPSLRTVIIHSNLSASRYLAYLADRCRFSSCGDISA